MHFCIFHFLQSVIRRKRNEASQQKEITYMQPLAFIVTMTSRPSQGLFEAVGILLTIGLLIVTVGIYFRMKVRRSERSKGTRPLAQRSAAGTKRRINLRLYYRSNDCIDPIKHTSKSCYFVRYIYTIGSCISLYRNLWQLPCFTTKENAPKVKRETVRGKNGCPLPRGRSSRPRCVRPSLRSAVC